MATEDLGRALEQEKRLQNLLLKSLLPRDDADKRDCVLEVRAGITSVGITYHAINDMMQRENSDVFIDTLLMQQEIDVKANLSSSQ